MPTLFGYAGRIAIVDLGQTRVTYDRPVDDELYKLVGGRGLGSKRLLDWRMRNSQAEEPPFGIYVGPLTGTGVPLANRLTFVFSSPLTGTIAYANTGGYAGTALKLSGLDGIAIHGEAATPKYLLVKDREVEIQEASGIWGRAAPEAVALLRAKHGDVRVLSIGPAGENLVKFANVVNDAGRASGVRHGAGCVLGRKKLKAVVIKSDYSRRLPIANRDAFKDVLKTLSGRMKSSPLLNRQDGPFSVHGTPIAVGPLDANNALPIKNYTSSRLENAEDLSGETMSKTILVSRLTCNSCSVQCRRETATLKKYQFRVEGPDYAQISSLGTNCAVTDLESIAYMNYLCYNLGLDPIEAGNMLAMYAEATERGRLLPGGGGLRWGDVDKMIELIQQMSMKRGEGALLAEGSARVTESLHDESLGTAVKGITIQNTDPRVEPAWGLLNATENSGASAHIWVYPDLIYSFASIQGIKSSLPESLEDFAGIGSAVKRKQDLVAVLDSLQVCAFSAMAFETHDYADALNAVTGWDWTEEKLLEAGDRIFNLERRFNNVAGVEPDALPPKFRTPITEGKHSGKTCNLGEMLSIYYRLRGWNDGIVPSEKLKRLGILN